MFKKKSTKPVTENVTQEVRDPPRVPHSHDESNWLISYADMMTLLCGFFIMLFSMCKLDTPQYDSFKEAISKQFGSKVKVFELNRDAAMLGYNWSSEHLQNDHVFVIQRMNKTEGKILIEGNLATSLGFL